MSMIGSLSDTPDGLTPLHASDIRKHIKTAGGVIAHWNDLNALLPNTAKALGYSDDYLHVRAAAIDNPADDAQSRTIDILVDRKGRQTWYPFHAYDVQNVCVEGSRQT